MGKRVYPCYHVNAERDFTRKIGRFIKHAFIEKIVPFLPPFPGRHANYLGTMDINKASLCVCACIYSIINIKHMLVHKKHTDLHRQ